MPTQAATRNLIPTTSESRLPSLIAGAAAYPDELNRWIRVAGLPMLAACICIGLAFGTRFAWFYAGAIGFGPGIGVLAIIYLAISSDTNGSVVQEVAIEPSREVLASTSEAAAA